MRVDFGLVFVRVRENCQDLQRKSTKQRRSSRMVSTLPLYVLFVLFQEHAPAFPYIMYSSYVMIHYVDMRVLTCVICLGWPCNATISMSGTNVDCMLQHCTCADVEVQAGLSRSGRGTAGV